MKIRKKGSVLVGPKTDPGIQQIKQGLDLRPENYELIHLWVDPLIP